MLHKRWASLLMAVLMLCCAVAPTGAFAEDASAVPVEVTEAPVVEMTEAPTEIPTEAPTEAPTEVPTEAPTKAPTEVPTEAPTEVPTEAPTEDPTEAPTEVPTEAPTAIPTEAPTAAPTEAPDVFVPGYARLSGGTKLYDTPALQGEACKLDGGAVVYAAKRTDDKTAVKVAVFDGASVVEKWVKAERVAMMSAAEAQQHEASCGDGASYAGCVLPAATVVAPQPAATEAPIVTEAPAAGIADMIATVATNPPVVAPSLPSGEQVATIESRSPLKVVALHAASATANIGDTLAFTTQFTGSGSIAWIEYHIYNTYGQHLTGYRGEGAGISGVYYYDTTVTGAGKYCARVYLMAKDGTFSHVDSIWVTVENANPLHVTALNAASLTADAGDILTFTTQFEGKGDIQWIEYHIYNTYGQHLTGYRGEGAGISGVYNYDTSVTGPGKYCARVYLMAKDGTFTHVDSPWVEVTPGKPVRVVELLPSESTFFPESSTSISFTPVFEGEGKLKWFEYYIYDTNGNIIKKARHTGEEVTYNEMDFSFRPCDVPGVTGIFARAYAMGEDGTFSEAESEKIYALIAGQEGDFQYYIINGSAAVSGYIGTVLNQGLNIPATLGGCPVRAIYDDAFYKRSDLKGPLTLPESITSIGKEAFYNCSGLTGSLVLPKKLTSIGQTAFKGCSGFTGDLTLPAGLTTIEYDAFNGCSGFNGSLTLPSGLTSIGDWAFYKCNYFTGSLIIPKGVTTIGDGSFSKCSRFTSLALPDSVITVGKEAFYGCTGFTGRLILPAKLTSIGDSAFYECKKFTGSLIVPESVTTIGASAFRDCSGFNGRLVLPTEMTSIGAYAFYDCKGFIGDLALPQGLTSIKDSVFSYCSGFNGSLTLPDGLTSIGSNAFNECSSLTGSLTIPEGITSIGSYAFDECSGFTGSLTIPEGVTTIGSWAFCACKRFTNPLTLPESLTNIGYAAFSSTSIKIVHAPAGSYAAKWATQQGYTLVAK